MIEFVAMNRKVNIDLEPGLYNFHPDSATGKTLLVKMVKSIGEKNKIAITYHDMLMGLDIEKIIAGKPQLLILDRFDLYDHEAGKLEVLKHSNCITLVDYKTERNFCDFDDTCFVTLQKNKLEVSL